MGLRLDRLTVEDPYHPGRGEDDVRTYFDIQALIASRGWKELHYISPSVDFIASSNDPEFERVVQPDGWVSAYKDVVNVSLEVEVEMYVANKPGVAGMAEEPKTRSPYVGIPGHLLPGYDGSAGLTGDGREVLVVARLTGDVSWYIQNGSGLEEDIEKLFNEMTWEEFKRSPRYRTPQRLSLR